MYHSRYVEIWVKNMPFGILFGTETMDIWGVCLPYHMSFNYSMPTEHRFYRPYTDICDQNLFLPINQESIKEHYAFQSLGFSAFYCF